MNEKLISLAREASSPEEILKLAKENDIHMVIEEAEAIYERLHANGEVSDEELASTAGGCKGAGGRTIVTSTCQCFTGKYEDIDDSELDKEINRRTFWYTISFDGRCGRCKHLDLFNGIGYCKVE